jgi:LysR family transcriptional regulator for bpeEF and oprC
LLRGVREAEALISQDLRPPAGTLRVDIPLQLGKTFVMPALPRFTARYPNLQVQAVFREQYSDLLNLDVDLETVDMAIRIGDSTSPNLAGKKIGTTRRVTCASANYLRQFGEPERPEHLLQHNCLGYLSALNWRTREWRFAEGRSVFSLSVHGNLVLSTTDCVVHAAILGMGIIQVQEYIAAPSIRQGLLQPILHDWAAPVQPVLALYSNHKEPSAKVVAFIKFLSQALPDDLTADANDSRKNM